ncbi:Hypothetical predicted protein, partial [Olea europaea subsp. europaea]
EWSLIFYINDHLLVADGCVPATNMPGRRKFTTATVALVAERCRLRGKIVDWNFTSATIYLVSDGHVLTTKIPWSPEVYNNDHMLVVEATKVWSLILYSSNQSLAADVCVLTTTVSGR